MNNFNTPGPNYSGLQRLGLRVVFNFLFLAITTGALAQDSFYKRIDTLMLKRELTKPVEPPIVYTVVDNMPVFPGGFDSMNRFLLENTVYPDSAFDCGIKTKVRVQFIIDETGKVTDANIVSGMGCGFDEEVLRVINLMPNWKPGTHKGKPVKVKFVVPIQFELE